MYPLFAETVSSIRPKIPVQVLPGKASLTRFTFLSCLPEPNSQLNQSDYVSRWTTPSGEMFKITILGFEQFTVLQGTDQEGRQLTLLRVAKLSYQDAGNYTCEVKSSSAPAQSPWLSASVELQLEGEDTCIVIP